MSSERLVSVEPVKMGRFPIVDLAEHYNNDGITHPGDVPNGDLNGEGMAFPYEELPDSNEAVELAGVPFLFPDKDSGTPNNVCMEGQSIDVPPGAYTRLHVLGVSDGGSFEELVMLHYADGSNEDVVLGLTDCRPHWGRTRFGERDALRFDEMYFPPGAVHPSRGTDICGLWVQTVCVNGMRELSRLQMGDNPSMHLFALTLEARDREERGGVQ